MPEEFQKGQRFGPYILQEELGRGSYGVVWLAERRAELTTTRFALKFPLDPDVDVEAVRKEAKLWVQASGHPNIIPVFEAAIYSGQIVIVSEYAPEGTLKDWLKRCGGKAPDIHSAVTMCTGILAGLKHLHSKKLLHRDLKPGNILLQGELPRIADFGLARVLRSVTSTHSIVGTPAYMAPEVWQGDRCFESDIWSVGVLLYEMLAGHRPFQATQLRRLKTCGYKPDRRRSLGRPRCQDPPGPEQERNGPARPTWGRPVRDAIVVEIRHEQATQSFFPG